MNSPHSLATASMCKLPPSELKVIQSLLTDGTDLEVADVYTAETRHKRYVSSWGSVSVPSASLFREVYQVFTVCRTIGAGIGKLVVNNKIIRGPLWIQFYSTRI